LFEKDAQILSIEIEQKRPARFLFLRPTDMRREPKDYSSFFKVHPMEIKFFQAKGYTTSNPPSLPTEALYDVPTLRERVKVEVFSSCWEPVEEFLGRIDQFPYHQTEPSVPSTSHRLLLSTGEVGEVSQVRITVKGSAQAVSAQAFRQNQVQFHEVRKRLLSESDEINRKFVEMLTDFSLGQEKRRAAQSLLTFLMQKPGSLVQRVHQQLNMEEYLQLTLLEEGPFMESFAFIKSFTKVEGFSQGLLRILLDMLTKVTEMKFNAKGLSCFFALLEWCRNVQPREAFLQALSQLRKVGELVRIKRELLEYPGKVPSLMFEKELFSFENLEGSHESPEQTE